MEYRPYGPRGAESEREDFWTDIPEGSDMVPDLLPNMPDEMETDGSVPYCPACPTPPDRAWGDEGEGGTEPDTDPDLNGPPRNRPRPQPAAGGVCVLGSI